MSLPKRTREHRVDEKAVSMIGDMLVDDWLVRSQEGRDYGIDLQMERYDGERPTGDFIFVQVKGTEAAFSSENEKLSGFPVKTVNYAMLFSVPFFVFYASVSSWRVKFVWLQKYVEFVLEKTRPGWRDQESVTLEFPRENDLDSGLEKLVDIAAKERSMRFGYRYLMLYERFHTFAGKLAEGELKATRVCARTLAEIIRMGGLEEYKAIDFIAMEAEVQGCEPSVLLQDYLAVFERIEHGGAASDEDMDKIRRIDLLLSLGKPHILNVDTMDVISAWISGSVPY